MKSLLNVNLYLKVFPCYMLSAWVKHQIVDINIQGFSSPELPINSKLCFSQWKIYFSPFIAKFIKFVVQPYVNSLLLCKLLILFSTVQLKLGHNFSQFIHRFKIGTFECWS